MSGLNQDFVFGDVQYWWDPAQTVSQSQGSDSEAIEYYEEEGSDFDDDSDNLRTLKPIQPELVKKRILKIDAEIERIRSLLLVVIHPTGLMRSLDHHAIPPPPIHSLPEEVLSEIFLTCVSNWNVQSYYSSPSSTTLDRHHPPWIFLAICKAWRNLALTFPKLWSYIVIHTNSARTELAVKILHLSTEVMLHRSYGCPSLYINVHGWGNGYRSMDYAFYKKGWSQIIGALIEHSYRWKGVRFELAACFFEQLSILKGDDLPLTSCYARLMDDDEGKPEHSQVFDALKGCTSLRQVRFEGFGSMPILQWSRLTHYESSREPLAQLEVIKNMPLLTFLKLAIGRGLTAPVGAETITCPKLKCFNFNGHLDYLNNFELPVLEELRIDWIKTVDGLLSLINRSGCSLKRLAVVGWSGMTEEALRSIFNLTPELASWTYDRLSNTGLTCDLLAKLTPASSAMPLLPKLEDLKVGFNAQTEQAVADALLTLIGSRRGRRTGIPDVGNGVARLRSVSVSLHERNPLSIPDRLEPFFAEGLDVSVELSR